MKSRLFRADENPPERESQELESRNGSLVIGKPKEIQRDCILEPASPQTCAEPIKGKKLTGYLAGL